MTSREKLREWWAVRNRFALQLRLRRQAPDAAFSDLSSPPSTRIHPLSNRFRNRRVRRRAPGRVGGISTLADSAEWLAGCVRWGEVVFRVLWIFGKKQKQLGGNVLFGTIDSPSFRCRGVRGKKSTKTSSPPHLVTNSGRFAARVQSSLSLGASAHSADEQTPRSLRFREDSACESHLNRDVTSRALSTSHAIPQISLCASSWN